VLLALWAVQATAAEPSGTVSVEASQSLWSQ